MDVNAIAQAGRITSDERGEPVVMLPLALWQELLNQLKMQPPQHERIKAILKQWEAEPDNMPSVFWDAFDADLKANRTTFHER